MVKTRKKRGRKKRRKTRRKTNKRVKQRLRNAILSYEKKERAEGRKVHPQRWWWQATTSQRKDFCKIFCMKQKHHPICKYHCAPVNIFGRHKTRYRKKHGGGLFDFLKGSKTRKEKARRRHSRKKRGGKGRNIVLFVDDINMPDMPALPAAALSPLPPLDPGAQAALLREDRKEAATHIQALYRGNRGRWFARHRREGLRRREERLRAQDAAAAAQNALNMAPTGIFWLDRDTYATAPDAVAEAAAAAARGPSLEDGDIVDIGGGAHFTRRTFNGGRRKTHRRKKRRRRRRRKKHGGGLFDFLKGSKTRKEKARRRKEKEEQEETQMRKRTDQEFKLHLAAAAEKDYEASKKQEGLPNIERMAKMRAAARTAWEYFMTTPKYKTFLLETWKVNWGERPFTGEEFLLLQSLKRYDPVGYVAINQQNPPS